MNRAERRRQKKLAGKKSGNAKPIISTDFSIEQSLNLAQQHHVAGRLPNAERIYHQILQTDPNHLIAMNLLGVIAVQVGKHDIAVDLLTKALAIEPNFAEAHNNLGNAFKVLGRQEAAMSSYRKAVAIEPDFAEALLNLANELKEQGRLEDAVTSLQKALASRPDYAEALYNLGIAFKEMQRPEEAIVSYQRALSIKPNYAEAHYNLGNVFKGLARLDEATESFRKALAINPSLAEAWNNLGNTLQALGKLNEAVECYRKTVSFKPELTEAHRQITKTKKFSEYDHDIKAMEFAIAKPRVNDEQRMDLAFGLGKAFDDLGQHKKAFEYFSTANVLKRSTFDFSIESVKFQFQHLKDLFSKNFFESHQAVGFLEETPIFILGMPRSGTTLIEQILASHPDVYGAGELLDLKQVISAEFGEIGDASFPGNVNQADNGLLSDIGQNYINAIRNRSNSSRFITDKMPNNFQLIGMIKLILPNAKIIHCCRDPLDTCWSIYKNLFTSHGNYYAYDLGELGRYYSLYLELMDHWRRIMPEFIFDIHYENLVANQEPHTRELLDYCDLEWNDACLGFHKTNRPVFTASAAQVRQPINKDSIQSWKNYEKWLGPLFEAI